MKVGRRKDIYRRSKHIVAPSFKDAAYDYVFCKESYHHFPRPMLELYEMLRVASKGVLLIEPNDAYFEGVGNEKLSEKGPLQKKVRVLIGIRDLLCRLGFMDYKLLATIILKKEPSKKLLRQLAKEGYEIIHLPDNPYISDRHG